MFKIVCLIASLFLLSCKTTNYYVVRHAEKETNTMTSDVLLSAVGEERAIALKNTLGDSNISTIFSTNYKRTLATVEPLRKQLGITIRLYDTKDTLKGFVNTLNKLDNGNVLIVGHSNTVDDIVNKLSGEKKIAGDLQDSQYGDLFVVKKRGNNYSFEKRHFGQ